MGLNRLFVLIAAGFAAVALILFWISRILSRRTGIPEGRIIYSDHGHWNKNKKPLYDAGSGLTGKPDYLIRMGDHIIPAEVKSSFAPRSPYDSHLLQLAAYCFLVESTFGKRPPYGLLRYRNRTFKIKYTRAIEDEVWEMVEIIRLQKQKESVPRSHQSPSRCASCGFRATCDQRL